MQFGVGSHLSKTMSSGLTEKVNKDFDATFHFKQEMSSGPHQPSKKKYARTPPKCKVCLVRFKDYNRLEMHLRKDHPEAEKVYCEICRKVFYTRPIMLLHLRAVHRKKRDKIAEKYKDTRITVKDSQCHICGVSMSKNYLKEHVNNVHLKEKEACEYCGQEYKTTCGLKEHILNKHPEKTDRTKQQCHKCERSFPNGSELRRHLYKVHKETITCEFCSEEFAMTLQLKRHWAAEHPDEYNEMKKKKAGAGNCEICEKYFPSKFALRQHARSHEDPSFECDICNKVVSRKQSLLYHKRRIHGNLKPYSCDFCHKEFMHNKGLISHMISVHQVTSANNEEPCKADTTFHCSVCSKCFSTKQGLTRHMRTHDGNLRRKSNVPKVTEESSQIEVESNEEEPCEESGNDGGSKENTLRICQKPKSGEESSPEDLVSVKEEHKEEKYDPMNDVNGEKYENQLESKKAFYNPNDSLNDIEVKKEPTEDETDLKTKESNTPKTSFFKALQEGDICLSDIKKEPRTRIMDRVDEDIFPSPYDPLSPFDGEESEGNPDENQRNEADNIITDQPFPEECHDFEDKSENEQNKTNAKGTFPCPECQKEFSTNYYRNVHHKSAHLGLMYACKLCSFDFAIKNQLDRHVAKCHPEATEGGDNKCNHCGKTFLTAVYLDQHKILIHPGGEKCKICSEELSTQVRLERHIRLQHPNEYKSILKLKKQRRRVNCEICGKVLSSKAALEGHIKQLHEGVARFSCDHCKESFTTARNLNNHIMNDHPDVPRISCEVCYKEFSLQSYLNIHKYSVHSDRPRYNHRCKKCDFKTESLSALERHVSTEHPESEKFLCDKCGKGWYVKGCLTYHRSTVHEKEEKSEKLKVICDVCGKEFKHRNYLSNHIKVIHNKEKPHKCEYCEKTFTQKHFMKLHMEAVHLKVKKHQCPDCGEAFTLKMYLKSHIIFKHTEKAFTCQYCGKGFAAKQNMERHVRMVHFKEKPFACDLCDKRFSTSGNMKVHMKSSH